MSQPDDPLKSKGGPGDHPEHDHNHGASVAGSAPAVAEQDEAGTRALADALQSSFGILKFAMAVMLGVFFVSGVFIVPPQQRAVVFRFGNPVGPPDKQLLGPGLHFAFPRPIDEVLKIPTSEIQTVRSTVGWYNTTPEAEATGQDPFFNPFLNPATDGYTLTGDANIIHVRATLRYLIADPLSYKLQFVEASNVVQNILNNAIFYASAIYPVDRAMDVVSIKDAVFARVQAQVAALKLGIVVTPPDVEVKPPFQVRNDFQAVLKASQTKDKAINLAQGYKNIVMSKASGESNQVVNLGLTDKSRLLAGVASDAKTLANLLPSYEQDPRLFYERRLTETLQRVLTNSQDKYFMPDRVDGEPRQLRLLLSREPEKPITQSDTNSAPGGK
jgi:membrane protease subunit HflK